MVCETAKQDKQSILKIHCSQKQYIITLDSTLKALFWKKNLNKRRKKKQKEAFISLISCSNYTCHTLNDICFKSVMISSKQTNIWLPNHSSSGLQMITLSVNIWGQRKLSFFIPSFRSCSSYSCSERPVVNSPLFMFFSPKNIQNKGKNYLRMHYSLQHISISKFQQLQNQDLTKSFRLQFLSQNIDQHHDMFLCTWTKAQDKASLAKSCLN